MEAIVIELAGYRKRFLQCDGINASCGHISDGVLFSFKDHTDDFEGSWVMSVKDLFRLADAVRQELASVGRENHEPTR